MPDIERNNEGEQIYRAKSVLSPFVNKCLPFVHSYKTRCYAPTLEIKMAFLNMKDLKLKI